MAAAHALAQLVSEADLEQGSLYPALPRIREVSAHIAAAVAAVAYQRGLASGPAPNDLRALVECKCTTRATDQLTGNMKRPRHGGCRTGAFFLLQCRRYGSAICFSGPRASGGEKPREFSCL